MNECIGYKDKHMTDEPRLWLTLNRGNEDSIPYRHKLPTDGGLVSAQGICRRTGTARTQL